MQYYRYYPIGLLLRRVCAPWNGDLCPRHVLLHDLIATPRALQRLLAVAWPVKSSQVMCIYTGTHQLFPTHVLARRRSPGTVVRVRYRFTLHISRSISLSFIHHYLWFGFAGDTILVYPILRCLSYLPHYLPLLPDVRHDVVDVRLILGAPVLRPARSRVRCVVTIMARVPFHLLQ